MRISQTSGNLFESVKPRASATRPRIRFSLFGSAMVVGRCWSTSTANEIATRFPHCFAAGFAEWAAQRKTPSAIWLTCNR